MLTLYRFQLICCVVKYHNDANMLNDCSCMRKMSFPLVDTIVTFSIGAMDELLNAAVKVQVTAALLLWCETWLWLMTSATSSDTRPSWNCLQQGNSTTDGFLLSLSIFHHNTWGLVSVFHMFWMQAHSRTETPTRRCHNASHLLWQLSSSCSFYFSLSFMES